MTEDEAEIFLADRELKQKLLKESKLAQGLPTHELDLDIRLTPWLVAKVAARNDYAQHLYAALCNNVWQEQDVWKVLCGDTWYCSWRAAGSIVAGLLGEGSYLDWYCSGIGKLHCSVPEGTITDEVRHDLASIGWICVDEN